MDCVSPILDVATRLCDCIAKGAVYIRELEENLNSLKTIMEELNNLSEDVKGRVERAEEQQMRRTREVEGWLRSVQIMKVDVEDLLRKGDQQIQNRLLGTCPKSCRSSYRLGKTVCKKISAVTELRGKGHFAVVADWLPCDPVDERPMEKTVGLDLMFQKVQRWLEDEQVRSIGLFGIGGVGKTTLLQKINNEFFGKRNDFDVVIWIVVSKPTNIEKIQEAIRQKLQIPDDKWKNGSREEKAVEILKLLKAKRFVLLLDDMWERLNLTEVGIPRLNDHRKCKVVLTTRSEQVCDQMEVHKRTKVRCLGEEEAFSLFCEKVGENIINSHPDIKKLAKIIVEECKGLPLALTTIGRSMASRKSPRAWEQAIRALKSYPAKFPGTGDQIFPVLKFSYDDLSNDTVKSCFLYCSMFPEDYEIRNEDLIQLWIGEGFLKEFSHTNEARNQGEEIIRSLKLACLLEGDASEDTSRMHDVIRDMALWLACDYGEEKHKSFVLDHAELIQANEIMKWEDANRISLWHCNLSEELMVSPRFQYLRTLLLRDCDTKPLLIGFFQFMPVIRVLDLSGTRLVKLPLEICRLGSLEYLNLAWTGIPEVPIELKNLTKLRCLILDYTWPKTIPPAVISCFSRLELFSMRFNHWVDLLAVLQELECLQHLGEISISLTTGPAVQKLLTSQKLQKGIRHLVMRQCDGLKIVELPFSTLQRLRVLEFDCCRFDLESIKIKMEKEERCGFPGGHISNSGFHNLVLVTIFECHRLLDLTWLVYAPSLERLRVYKCVNMKEIIRDDEHGDWDREQENLCIFSRLEYLYLDDLLSLESICRRALPFPSLAEVHVYCCSKLRKLPLNCKSGSNSLKRIVGFSSWWEELEWEDDNLNNIFTPYFVSLGP